MDGVVSGELDYSGTYFVGLATAKKFFARWTEEMIALRYHVIMPSDDTIFWRHPEWSATEYMRADIILSPRFHLSS